MNLVIHNKNSLLESSYSLKSSCWNCLGLMLQKMWTTGLHDLEMMIISGIALIH